ncbi:MAG TPA: YiiX/YebB-like N1pC/P60 family cysteine hydrolase, partial [Pyrinomonadaceae bacterium]|nr:YiiX/YebB-like N1pC/P60 family cysteine hydrolase [Pyrinomonadaceae bacterium]
ATATLPTDMPGVRLVDWKKFVSGYSHVGVVRLKGKSAKDLTSIVSWVSERQGKPYRWPIIQGLNKTDQSRFYCSQLVWLAFREVLNLDLDVDKGVLVFPDDIYYSKEYVDVIVP